MPPANHERVQVRFIEDEQSLISEINTDGDKSAKNVHWQEDKVGEPVKPQNNGKHHQKKIQENNLLALSQWDIAPITFEGDDGKMDEYDTSHNMNDLYAPEKTGYKEPKPVTLYGDI